MGNYCSRPQILEPGGNVDSGPWRAAFQYGFPSESNSGPWRAGFKRRFRFRCDSLDALKSEFYFDIQGSVQLKATVQTLADSEQRVSVRVTVESVSCSISPLYSLRSGESGVHKDATNPNELTDYRTFCSVLNIFLVPETEVSSGDVNVITHRSTNDRKWDQETSFTQQTAIGAKVGSSGLKSNVAFAREYGVRRKTESTCWSLELLQGGKYGFCFECDVGELNKLSAGTRMSTMLSSYLSCACLGRTATQQVLQEPWMHLIKKTSKWNDVNFASDRFPSAIEWKFPHDLQHSNVKWVMDIQLRILVIRISHLDPVIVEEISFPSEPEKLHFEFDDVLIAS